MDSAGAQGALALVALTVAAFHVRIDRAQRRAVDATGFDDPREWVMRGRGGPEFGVVLHGLQSCQLAS